LSWSPAACNKGGIHHWVSRDTEDCPAADIDGA
jgi:hypothetical protein